MQSFCLRRGSYFSDGLKPVPIMVETEDVRAVRGGTGEAKCGGNYAAANRAGDKALEKRAIRRSSGWTAWSVNTSKRAAA